MYISMGFPIGEIQAIRLLGNPYAVLGAFENLTEPVGLSEAEANYVFRQENPYARLSIVPPIEPPSLQAKAVVPSGISQRDFTVRCRKLLGQYIPKSEKGKLRPQHRAFIERNKKRSAVFRKRLLLEMSKYDLSGNPGLQVQFNREDDDPLAKLAALEKKLLLELG